MTPEGRLQALLAMDESVISFAMFVESRQECEFCRGDLCPTHAKIWAALRPWLDRLEPG